MNKLMVGIVGAGEITKLVHLPVLKNFVDVEITWISDKDNSRAKTLKKMFDIKNQIIMDENIDFPHCDVVLLATPVFARKVYVEYFGKCDVAVLAEKPFAVSQQEHQHYLTFYPNNQIHCGYMRRTYSSIRALKQIVQEEWFGKLREIEYSEGGRVTRSINFGMDGGILRDLGCHGIDVLLYITGAKKFSVLNSYIEWDQDTDRQVSSKFTLASQTREENADIPVDFEVSWLTPQSNSIVLKFDNANIRSRIGPETQLEIQGLSKARTWTSMSLDVHGARSSYQAFYLEWKEVFSSLRYGTGGEFAATTCLTTTSLVDLIYQQGGN